MTYFDSHCSHALIILQSVSPTHQRIRNKILDLYLIVSFLAKPFFCIIHIRKTFKLFLFFRNISEKYAYFCWFHFCHFFMLIADSCPDYLIALLIFIFICFRVLRFKSLKHVWAFNNFLIHALVIDCTIKLFIISIRVHKVKPRTASLLSIFAW